MIGVESGVATVGHEGQARPDDPRGQDSALSADTHIGASESRKASAPPEAPTGQAAHSESGPGAAQARKRLRSGGEAPVIARGSAPVVGQAAAGDPSWGASEAARAHNPERGGSTPPPATTPDLCIEYLPERRCWRVAGVEFTYRSTARLYFRALRRRAA